MTGDRPMTAFENILVPIDFSDTSTEALKTATTLAEAMSATVHLLHVVEKPHLAVGGTAFVTFSAVELVERLVHAAETRMAALTSSRQGITMTTVARVGVPFHEIIRYAEDTKTDLIVMGTHGRGTVGHALLGSVAERVLRRAPCPVLTVRHPGQEAILL